MNCPLFMANPNCERLCAQKCVHNGEDWQIFRNEAPQHKPNKLYKRKGCKTGCNPYTRNYDSEKANKQLPILMPVKVSKLEYSPSSSDHSAEEELISDRLFANGESHRIAAAL